jgi:hypothetical protein
MRQISTGKMKNKMKLVEAARKKSIHEEQYYEDGALGMRVPLEAQEGASVRRTK